jgi:ABC-2 type transport system ATP-binding protein
MIELCNVTRLYRTVIGVNDMTLKLEPGAYGLLGPNGAGKTTLLNLITGQLRTSLGTVRIFGEDPLNNPSVLRRLGVCPGEEAMYANGDGRFDAPYHRHVFARDAPADEDGASDRP